MVINVFFLNLKNIQVYFFYPRLFYSLNFIIFIIKNKIYNSKNVSNIVIRNFLNEKHKINLISYKVLKIIINQSTTI